MKRLAPHLLVALACGFIAATTGAANSDSVRSLNARGLSEAPIYFEPTGAGKNTTPQFVSRNSECAVLISANEVQLMVSDEKSTAKSVHFSFVGANAAKVSGCDQLSGRASYFIGSEQLQWRTGVPLFRRVQLDDVYAGVQMVFYPSKSAQLEYDFVVQPGVDPKQIGMQISGADKVLVDHNGDLVLKVGRSEIRQPKPFTYQIANGQRKEITSAWQLINKTTATFSVAEYDRALPLVIDPTVLNPSFSTYLGGQFGERGWDITADASGNVYICGDTFSPDLRTNFISAPFAIYSNGQDGHTNSGTQGTRQYGDAFVAKFTPTGPSNTLQLAYLTYLGGRGQEAATGIAVDSAGNAYVTGFTDSPNFPTTTNAAFPTITGINQTASHIFRVDAFVTKIDPSGTSLVYSSYLGGGERDSGNAIAVDGSGYAFVAGFTQSSNFPVGTNISWVITNRIAAATNSFVAQNRYGGIQDAFVTKFDSDGSKLIYSTFLGGTNQDSATSIKVDAFGAAYVTGYTLSTNFPTVPTNNTVLNQRTNKQNILRFDGFFTKISPDGTTLDYSQFLGGESSDIPLRLALLSSNDVFITGYTYSSNYPVTGVITNSRAWTNTRTNVNPDIFVTRLHETYDGTNFLYTTNSPGYSVLFGGGKTDEATGLAVDPSGNAVVVGITTSTNLFGPATQRVLVGTNFITVTNQITFDVFFGTNAYVATNSIAATNKFKRIQFFNYVFVAALNSDASAFTYKAYLGGHGDDVAHGIALDPSLNLHIVGNTTSSNYPSLFPLETRPGGKKNTNDVFITTIPLGSVLP